MYTTSLTARIYTQPAGITVALQMTTISKRPNFKMSRTKRKVTPVLIYVCRYPPLVPKSIDTAKVDIFFEIVEEI